MGFNSGFKGLRNGQQKYYTCMCIVIFLIQHIFQLSIEKLMHSLSYNGGRVFRHTDTHELDDAGNLVWNLENRL